MPCRSRGNVRTNLAITESDGTTTKVNEPASGARSLSGRTVRRGGRTGSVRGVGGDVSGVQAAARTTRLLVLRRRWRFCAVTDARWRSTPPTGHLAALAAGLDLAAPDLLAELEELAGLSGVTYFRWKPHWHRAIRPVVTAARRLDRGVGAVLATPGAAGAVLPTAPAPGWPPRRWCSRAAPSARRLAGGICARDICGASAPARLQMAVAYGSAAAALPGSALPTPAQLNLDDVVVTSIADPSEGVS